MKYSKLKTTDSISIAMFASILIYCFVSVFLSTPWGDEIAYHYPNTQKISYRMVIEPDSDYASAYTPLPYFIGHLVLDLHNSLIALRLLNFTVSILLFNIIYKLCRKFPGNPWTLTLIVFLNPYMLRGSYAFYLTNYGLLFSLIGVYIYYFSSTRYGNGLSHFFLSLAVLSQQWMLVVVFAIFLNDIIVRKAFNSFNVDYLKRLAVRCILFVPPVFLFVKWGGLTHPNYQAHTLHPMFEHLNAVLLNWGFIMILVVIFNISTLKKTKLINIIYLVPLLFLSLPEHGRHHGDTVITGITSQIAMQIERFVSIPYKASIFLFTLSGLAVLLMFLNKASSVFEKFLVFALLGFLAAFTASTKLSSSHIFVSMPFLLLLFNREISASKWIKAGLLLQLFLLSAFYITYFTFFVTRGQGF